MHIGLAATAADRVQYKLHFNVVIDPCHEPPSRRGAQKGVRPPVPAVRPVDRRAALIEAKTAVSRFALALSTPHPL